MANTVDNEPDWLAERPANLVSDLCWLLSRATDRQEREFGAEALKASGLTARKHHVLMAAMDAVYTQNELARTVGVDTTTMVATIDELERDGLAERHIAPTDRRRRIVKVTPAGARAVAKCDQALRAAQNRIMARLPEEQRDMLLSALARLAFADDASS